MLDKFKIPLQYTYGRAGNGYNAHRAFFLSMANASRPWLNRNYGAKMQVDTTNHGRRRLIALGNFPPGEF